MRFAKDTTEFPSGVHSQIYTLAIRQTPPEVSLPQVAQSDPALADSCRAYYSYIQSLLSDMYDHPLEYGFPVGEYEAFLGGRKPHAARRAEQSKEIRLRSQMQNCARNYFMLLLAMGLAGEVRNDALVLPEAFAPPKKTASNPVPFEDKLAALRRTGLRVEPDNDAFTVTCNTFPGMMPALHALARSSEKKQLKPFGTQGFKHCEFRQILSNHKPTYQDIMQPLTEEKRACMDALADHLAARKATTLIETFWIVNYKYKGNQLCSLNQEPENHARAGVTAAYWTSDTTSLMQLLEDQDDDFKRFVLRHLNYCTGCSTSHEGGGFVTILGKRKRLCGGIGVVVTDPSPDDVKHLSRFMDLVIQTIDEAGGKRKKKEA